MYAKRVRLKTNPLHKLLMQKIHVHQIMIISELLAVVITKTKLTNERTQNAYLDILEQTIQTTAARKCSTTND
jgi:hypothetical protein